MLLDLLLTSSFFPCTSKSHATIFFLKLELNKLKSNLRKESCTTKTGCANALFHLQKKTKSSGKVIFTVTLILL